MKNSKKKTVIANIASILLVTVCICSIGYSAYLIAASAEQDAGVTVVASQVDTETGIEITDIVSSSNIVFDGVYLDSTGRVYSTLTEDETSTLDVTGVLKGYTNEAFVSITPVLQVESTYRDAYDRLIENHYIEEPSLSKLGVTASYSDSTETENSFYWTSAETENRTFRLSYEYTWGSFFNYMNPSEFFDSKNSNFEGRQGTSYSTSEIREILSEIAAINSASYTLYLDIETTSNTFSLTFDADGGYFTTASTDTTYTMTGLTYHSKVISPTPYKDSYIFNNWTYNSTATSSYFYLNELDTFTSGSSITLTASYTSNASTLIVQYTNADSTDASISFNVQSDSGYSSYTSVMGGTTSFSVHIGDVIYVTSTTSVGSLTASSGLEASNSRTFKVTASTCVLSVTPASAAATDCTVSFALDTSTSSNLDYLRFTAGSTVVTYSSSAFNTTVTVSSGDSLALSNLRGVASFKDEDGNTITSLDNITSDTTVTVVPEASVTLTVNYDHWSGTTNWDVTATNSNTTVTLASESLTSSATLYYYFVSGETWTIDSDIYLYFYDFSTGDDYESYTGTGTITASMTLVVMDD